MGSTSRVQVGLRIFISRKFHGEIGAAGLRIDHILKAPSDFLSSDKCLYLIHLISL